LKKKFISEKIDFDGDMDDRNVISEDDSIAQLIQSAGTNTFIER
jgi:hypothetical protein